MPPLHYPEQIDEEERRERRLQLKWAQIIHLPKEMSLENRRRFEMKELNIWPSRQSNPGLQSCLL